jgi:hypothetical protein
MQVKLTLRHVHIDRSVIREQEDRQREGGDRSNGLGFHKNGQEVHVLLSVGDTINEILFEKIDETVTIDVPEPVVLPPIYRNPGIHDPYHRIELLEDRILKLGLNLEHYSIASIKRYFDEYIKELRCIRKND